ncbi:MAG TPA: hypothetical protein VHG09_12400 [Longimicrobiales bacterium]|nr:hypothetical protein [Longimicrobiales bacterium]
MKSTKLLVFAGVVLVSISCADAPGITGPMDSAVALAAESSNATGPVAATGEYDAIVDFTTLTLTPRGSNCLLQVDGQLVFSGTIEGAATGTTTALVFATCPEVATAPPGTYPDVFKSELAFEGTIAGEPAAGDMMYQGRSQEGGRIEGHVIASRGIAGVLDVDAQLAVGGSYSGSLVVH